MKHAPSPKADWGAIVLHFIIGGIVGSGAILLGLVKGGFLYRHHAGLVAGILVGSAITSGAFYALWQNEAWIGDNYHVIPPIPPRHTRTSRMVLSCCSGLGALIIALSWLLWG